MCTLVVAWQVFEDAPVTVAANRDEAVDRRSRPPRVIEDDPEIVAPLDDEAGGTWIGYNEFGLLAAITNRWTDDEREGDRSRGLLVRDALRESTAEEAARTAERELRDRTYAGFNLVLADQNAAILLEWDGRLRVTNLEPGVHVVMNVGFDDAFAIPDSRRDAAERQIENARAVSLELQAAPGETSGEWLDRAGQVLGDHEYGVCVHGDGFGTRSSSLVALGDDTAYWYADGPPCRTEYERLHI